MLLVYELRVARTLLRLVQLTTVLVVLVTLVGTLQPVVSATPRSPVGPNIHDPIVYHPLSTTSPGSPPFAPSDIWKAYDYQPLYARGIKGNGTRIAIVDAYGDPTLGSDIATFDSLTGLPSASINVYYPDGIPRRGNSGWAIETALDTEWAHAVAPYATIDVIVGLDNSINRLYNAVQYVSTSLPQENTLSMSWGDYESNFSVQNTTNFHNLFTTMTNHGTSIFASSGDSGAANCCAAQYPASDPLIVGVGGTKLTLSSNASIVSETAWSGSGSGDSINFPKPAWQKGLGDAFVRVSADVAYDADPNSGVLVVAAGTQYTVGGTSAGSPQWAALVALANEANSKKYGAIDAKLYSLTSYHDITLGSDGYFFAEPGWDYPTGLGTPDAYAVVSQLSQGLSYTANYTETFKGVTATTKGNLTVSQFSGKLSGTVTVVARNSTTGMTLFNKTYTLTGLQLQSLGTSYSGSFILNIPILPDPLSSNIQISVNSGNVTGSNTITRRLDINGDGIVNIQDLAFVASVFGESQNSPSYDSHADIDAIGTITIVDLAFVAAYFGATDYL